MKTLSRYNDFLLDMIAEKASNGEVYIVISDRLKATLSAVDHPIARRIIESSNGIDDKASITYIDIDDSDPSKKDIVSFMTSSKVINLIKKHTKNSGNDNVENIAMYMNGPSLYQSVDVFHTNGRSSTRIGRVVKKLYGSEFKDSGDDGKDIESFVRMYKAARSFSSFELVSGEKIRYWYLQDRYVKGGGDLNGSCMRYDYTQRYLEFYVENPDKVSLLILKDAQDEEKIRGRALVWKLDEPSRRTFMDRIYFVNDYEIELFKQYARQNKWMYKSRQNMDPSALVVDTITGTQEYVELVVNDIIDPGEGRYPFMDTMRYLDADYGVLSNESYIMEGEVRTLNSTSGTYEEHCEDWSDYYDQCVDDDMETGALTWCELGSDYRYSGDCYYSDFYDEYVAYDYAQNDMIETDLYEDENDIYRLEQDVIRTCEGYRTDETYASKHLRYSKMAECYTSNDAYSKHLDDWVPLNDAVEVCLDAECTQTDYFFEIGEEDKYWHSEKTKRRYVNDVERGTEV